MSKLENKYKPVPFWSWNDELDEKELCDQIEWMHDGGIGGFFMHARGGLTTPYLGEKWFSCVEACLKKAKELDMEAYAYDENGWPSGFAGGKLLEDEKNCDMYFTYKYGPYDKNAKVSFDVNGDKAIRVTKGDNVLNIYLTTSNSTADICNKDVVRKFINLTHEEYKKHDIYGNLRGFFTDEPQYYRWNVPFTRVLPDYFKEHYNEDVFDRLALLFVDKEGYQDYRYKYFKSMQDLMLNNWAKQIYDWCSENNYKLTGHYVEESSMGAQIMCCGGVMPFYEFEHIPGVDHLGRYICKQPVAKQLGSVVSQLNKKEALCEMFACVGWDTTPLELKGIAEDYMNSGTTMICHHLLPYKEHGQRKRDYPEHYSAINPWVEKGFKDFNDHFSNIAKLLMNSHELVEVGLLEPIRTAYFTYKREYDWAGRFGTGELDDRFWEVNDLLNKNGIQYHILDEVIMARHAHVEGPTLVIGNFKYKYIVIPEGTLTMDVTTKNLFEEYARNGGKFLIIKDVPTYLEGHPFEHSYMKNNCSLEDLIKDKPFYSSPNENVKLAYRELDNSDVKFIYAANLGEETDMEIKVNGYKSFKCNDKVISQKLHFDKNESKILYFSNETPRENEKKNEIIKLGNHFKVVGEVTNYLTLDTLSYSFDGKNYTNKMHHMAIFNLLMEARYKGDLYLKYDFNIRHIPPKCEVLLEDTNTKNVYINGVEIFKNGTVLEKDLWKYDLANNLKEGNNEIVIKINFFESEQVYYVLYGENVQESLKNCLVYDTTIEPIYLRGDFGVYGDFEDGQKEDVIIGNNFYIDVPKKEVNCLIKDGYPFLRGIISLEQEIDVDNVNKTLLIDKRFQLIDLYVNDQFVKRMMFDYKADLSKYLKVGKNKLRLELVISNRNLLGPFHQVEEEPFSIGPYSFERLGTWSKDGSSYWYVPRYAFVKTIV